MDKTLQATDPAASQKDSKTFNMIAAINQQLDRTKELSADELDAFCNDLEVLENHLKKLSDDLKASYHICPNLTQKIISKQSTDEFFTLLENDDSLREKTKTKLQELSRCFAETEDVLRILPDFKAKKTAFDGVEDVRKRRRGKNYFDNCKDLQEELIEWKKSALRGLQKITGSGLPEKFDVGQLLPDDSSQSTAKTNKKERSRSSSLESRIPPADDLVSCAPPSTLAPGPTTKPSPEVKRSTPPAKQKEPRKDDNAMPEVREALNRWSSRHPLVPSRLGDKVSIAREKTKDLKILRISALWGERVVVRGNVAPFRGSGKGDQKSRALWEFPHTPPEDFKPGKERTFRIPGHDSVVDCRTCSGRGESPCAACNGSGQLRCKKCSGGQNAEPCSHCDSGHTPCGCDSGHAKCSACEGEGKLVRYDSCKTRYYVETLEEKTGQESLPARLISTQTGSRVFWEFLTEATIQSTGKAKHECLKAISEHMGAKVQEKVQRRFLDTESNTGQVGKEKMLIRLSIEILSLPLAKYVCRSNGSKNKKGMWQFDAWIYGKNKSLYASGYPQGVTWKATSWLGALVVAGIPVGYGLAQLVKQLF